MGISKLLKAFQQLPGHFRLVEVHGKEGYPGEGFVRRDGGHGEYLFQK
jgi:hypothetical protein